ncbi:MAG: hypothetical protein P8J87_14025, partial [Verrucomicrobiales bacterium]|nr:hypothetical protein [Verrucomicrobiales bacterium]
DLPEGVTTGELWRRWFPRGAGAIILYHVGKPNRTAIEFGREMAKKAGRARLQSILDACVKDAAQTRDPSAQLERFCVKYSIQAYWLERDLGQVGEDVEEVVVEEQAAVLEGGWWSRNFWPVVVTLMGAGTIGVAVWWSFRRRVVLFPEFDMPMRLGGAFSGGSDAVVHFGRNAGFEEKPKVLE